MAWIVFATIVYVLAVMRATRFANSDTLTEGPRIWLLKRWPKIAHFSMCPWCISIWVAALFAQPLQHETGLPWTIVAGIGLGASHLAGMFAQLDKDDIEISVER